MNNLNDFVTHYLTRQYHSDLSDEEIERRVQMFLEIFCFFASEFELKDKEENALETKINKYREIMNELRDKSTEIILNE